jgi:hypothetical protein
MPGVVSAGSGLRVNLARSSIRISSTLPSDPSTNVTYILPMRRCRQLAWKVSYCQWDRSATSLPYWTTRPDFSCLTVRSPATVSL